VSICPSVIDRRGERPCLPTGALLAVCERIAQGRAPSTIDELKAEKAELAVKLVNLEGRSRRATLDEIAESVRDKYDERYEGEGMDNE